MELLEPNYIELISLELEMKSIQVEAVLDLIKEWSTVPFIARYRKERTLNLDEKEIRNIIELQAKEETLYKAKKTAINWINEQWKLTPELEQNIINSKTLKEVEEIYKPYKLKKKTKSMIALEKWFWVVSEYLRKYNSIKIPEELLQNYSREEIIEWTIEIIWAEISNSAELREFLRENINSTWIVISKIKWEKALEKLDANAKKQLNKFEIYSDFNILAKKLKPYQILAINRWENLGILSVKIDLEEEVFDNFISEIINEKPIEIYLKAIDLWYKTLFKSVENEIRWILTEISEIDAIETFGKNLFNLLMTKPEYGKKVLAIDPGYRTGCKIAVLNEVWNPIYFDKIFIEKELEASKKLASIEDKFEIDVIVIWNWTWSNETIEIVEKFMKNRNIYVVNESWASVYSASELASEEFPDLDVTDRWTVSIGRRFIDPLSELVKINPKSIWVWMYQHDMNEKFLDERLGFVIEDVVNQVWVNVNSSSPYVLNYISGLNKKSAQKIFDNKPYKSRIALKKVLWPKTYEQAIWFLRIPESKEQFDNTDIHPEQYKLAKFIIEKDVTISNYREFEEDLKNIYPEITKETIEFILESYQNIWKDKRVNSASVIANKKIKIDQVQVWDILDWVVRNVLAFWVFVDIGLKNDWLVHISEIVNRFIKDPKEEVEVWEKVKVKVLKIDNETGKLQLSMKQV